MSRIDAIVGTQVGDVNRPRQTAADARLQSEQAQRADQAAPAGKPVSADELRAIAAQMKQVVEAASGRKLAFRVDEGTKDIVVEVIDASTNEVIKQIPTQDMLSLQHSLDRMVGLLLDHKA